CLLGDAARLVRADVELKPQGLRANRGRLACDLRSVFGRSEDVDDVDLLGDVEQGAIHPLAEEGFRVRVDRDNAKSPALEALRHRAAGLARVAGRAHHRDGLRPLEDLAGRPRHVCLTLTALAGIPALSIA